jgi:hypothetical protein
MSARSHGTAAHGGKWHPGMKGAGPQRSAMKLAPVEALGEEDEDEDEDDEFGELPRPVFDGGAHVGGVTGMAWCPTTGLVATGCRDGTVGLDRFFFRAPTRPPQVRRGPVSKADRDKQQSSPRKRRNSRGTDDVDPKRSPTKGDLKGLWPVVFVDAPSEKKKKKDDHRRASFQRD